MAGNQLTDWMNNTSVNTNASYYHAWGGLCISTYVLIRDILLQGLENLGIIAVVLSRPLNAPGNHKESMSLKDHPKTCRINLVDCTSWSSGITGDCSGCCMTLIKISRKTEDSSLRMMHGSQKILSSGTCMIFRDHRRFLAQDHAWSLEITEDS